MDAVEKKQVVDVVTTEVSLEELGSRKDKKLRTKENGSCCKATDTSKRKRETS